MNRVLEKIKDLEIEKKTLVIYTSDNGGCVKTQKPLRGEKGMYYEGGIRIPMIALWPGFIEPGSKCHEPVMHIDLFPTYLELAKAKIDKKLDGESLLPLLKQSGNLKRESIYWYMPGYLDRAKTGARDKNFRTRPVSVIRKGKWKLHLYHEEWILDGGRGRIDTNRAVELYNLENDISERNNLALNKKAVRNELLNELLSWQEEVKAPIPLEK